MLAMIEDRFLSKSPQPTPLSNDIRLCIAVNLYSQKRYMGLANLLASPLVRVKCSFERPWDASPGNKFAWGRNKRATK